jgi:hypothetical protein
MDEMDNPDRATLTSVCAVALGAKVTGVGWHSGK